MARMTLLLLAATVTLTLTTACSSLAQGPESPVAFPGTGQVIEYHANGKLKRKADYLDGQIVAVVNYYPSGTEQSNESFLQGQLTDATYFFADGRVKTRISSR